MKNINIVVENEAFERLLIRKGKLTWHAFLLTLAEEPARTWEQYAAEAQQEKSKLDAQAARIAQAAAQHDLILRYRAAATEEDREALRNEAKEKGWIKEEEDATKGP